MPATSKYGARRRELGIPADARAARKAEKADPLEIANDERHRTAVVNSILSRQTDIERRVSAMLLEAAPPVAERIIGLALGRHKASPSTQLEAGRYILDRSQVARGADGRMLSELPLDQLETVLSATLEATRQLQSLNGQSQRIDSDENAAPDSGADVAQPAASSEPDEPAPGA